MNGSTTNLCRTVLLLIITISLLQCIVVQNKLLHVLLMYHLCMITYLFLTFLIPRIWFRNDHANGYLVIAKTYNEIATIFYLVFVVTQELILFSSYGCVVSTLLYGQRLIVGTLYDTYQYILHLVARDPVPYSENDPVFVYVVITFMGFAVTMIIFNYIISVLDRLSSIIRNTLHRDRM